MLFYFIVAIFTYLLYVFIKSTSSLHMLQQNWYDDDHRYLKWMIRNKYKVLLGPDCSFVIFISFLFMNEKFQLLLFAVFYIFCFIFFRKEKRKEQKKLSFVVTKRIKRLFVTLFILYLIPILCMYFGNGYLPYYLFVLGMLSYLNFFVVMVANIINIPVEKQVYHYYRRKAMCKLRDMNHLKVVGITGSYGKTSSKNILSDILNVKINAIATPKNLNTPYGLIQSVNQHLDKFNDIFIAEMGAFKKGEIKELCELVHPTYGILTKIGEAHLESFGSRENIQKGKFELIESLPSNGVGILNGDDEYQLSYELKNTCKIIWIGIDNKDVDVRASKIKLTKDGTSFVCHFKGDTKEYAFETKLLGKANIYNILSAIALAKELGIPIDQIALGVKKVNTIEHRLELKKYGDVTIIDDAYNSNPVGSKMALEVLDMMPGKKIIVTPGMIELGAEQYERNMQFGEYIADVCDEVILVGEEQTRPIVAGLKNKKYKEQHIHMIQDVKLAFPLIDELKKGQTFALLENDLPDIFNEK